MLTSDSTAPLATVSAPATWRKPPSARLGRLGAQAEFGEQRLDAERARHSLQAAKPGLVFYNQCSRAGQCTKEVKNAVN